MAGHEWPRETPHPFYLHKTPSLNSFYISFILHSTIKGFLPSFLFIIFILHQESLHPHQFLLHLHHNHNHYNLLPPSSSSFNSIKPTTNHKPPPKPLPSPNNNHHSIIFLKAGHLLWIGGRAPLHHRQDLKAGTLLLDWGRAFFVGNITVDHSGNRSRLFR